LPYYTTYINTVQKAEYTLTTTTTTTTTLCFIISSILYYLGQKTIGLEVILTFGSEKSERVKKQKNIDRLKPVKSIAMIVKFVLICKIVLV